MCQNIFCEETLKDNVELDKNAKTKYFTQLQISSPFAGTNLSAWISLEIAEILNWRPGLETCEITDV